MVFVRCCAIVKLTEACSTSISLPLLIFFCIRFVVLIMMMLVVMMMVVVMIMVMVVVMVSF